MKTLPQLLVELFRKYKAVLRFILTFLGSYVLLVFLYQQYLDFFFSKGQPDLVTELVARQTELVINSFGYDAFVAASSMYPLMNLSINDIFIARIIEGCNSVSLIILFVAFMLSFLGRAKPSILYILAGTAIIYVMNIVRISLLSIGIYERPEYTHFLHKIVFPLVIYGTVFLLWMGWIYLYTKKSVK